MFFQNSKLKKGLFLFIIVTSILANMSFQNPYKWSQFKSLVVMDTLPKNPQADINIDLQIKELSKQMKVLDENLKNINWNNISNQITESLKNIDLEKIETDVASSLKNIDWDEIQENINTSLKNIDMKKINTDIKTAMENIKININSDELKKNMEEIKKIDMKKANADMKKAAEEIKRNQNEIKLEMEKEKQQMIKANGNLSLNKEMIGEMEKDNLINKKEDYTIEYKNKVLTINGKEQPEAVIEKYRKYFKGDSFKIQRNTEK